MKQDPRISGQGPPKRRRLRWAVVRVVSLVLVVYVGLIGCVMTFEDRFIYFPTKYPDGLWDLARSEAAGAPVVEDVWMTTSDGVKVHGWYCTPHGSNAATAAADGAGPAGASASGRPVIYWLHGNAGNLTHRYDSLVKLTQLGADVLIIDYRGYGRSEGAPSEDGIYRDARAGWDYLVNTRGVGPQRIVLFGKSLGAAPAIELATHVQPAGLIIEAAFTSIPDMVGAVAPLVPRFCVRTKMDSIDRIGRITQPKLFTHSRDDQIIPFALGRRLYEAAAEPKRFYEMRGAGHNNMHDLGGEAYWNAIEAFVRECVE